MELIKVPQSRNGGPYVFRTRLGWCIVGPVNGTKHSSVSCNKIAMRHTATNQIGEHSFQSKKEVKENDKVRFPNNRLQAQKKFTYLQRIMSRNHHFKNDYMKFMKQLMSNGYATESTATAENGKWWYLPHHGVYNHNRPGKIHVVLDLDAEFQRTLINKSLLPSPDLANQIVGVLLRFREEPVAVTVDFEALYHQVKIPVKQRSFLQFLWWKNSDPQNEVVDDEMTAHVFGGISFPSGSN